MLELYHTRDEIFHSQNCGDYRIMMCWPDQPAPDEGWPVIYLLDGARYFAIASSLLSTLGRPRCPMVPGVVVAIDYPGPSRRERDYRPAAEAIVAEANPHGGYYAAGMDGSAQDFLDVIQLELKPYIAEQLPLDLQQQALFGHSYGGLFTLNTLFTQSDAFQHYFASSPSVWWNDRAICRAAETFAQQLAVQPLLSPKMLYVSVGEYEQSLERWETGLPAPQRVALAKHRRQRHMVDGIRELAWTVQQPGAVNLQTELFIFPDQSHQTVSLLALQKAFLYHFRRQY
ncbi:hypothetical protein EDC52_10685 [Biostraticola tofi]|uniref:Esterase n=2 Tax=Biostraticola tofi TaxID=466109 RepID=A0A4R3YUW8_9GAMM|nr:hypothetical protein EDC52_10685 [Biostraticola tofi]